MYQCLYIDSKIKPKDVRKYIEEVMRYRGESELLEEWLQWEPPVFPKSPCPQSKKGWTTLSGFLICASETLECLDVTL